MIQKYKIQYFTRSIPINYYVPLADRKKVQDTIKYYGLYNYISETEFHYKWSQFSTNFSKGASSWEEPTKSTIELVFNITLLDV